MVAQTEAAAAAVSKPGNTGSATVSGPAVHYNVWPDNARPVEKWMHELLDQPVPDLDFPKHTLLDEILLFLANYYTETQGASGGGQNFRLTIWPDPVMLDEEQFERLTDITISGDLTVSGHTQESHGDARLPC